MVDLRQLPITQSLLAVTARAEVGLNRKCESGTVVAGGGAERGDHDPSGDDGLAAKEGCGEVFLCQVDLGLAGVFHVEGVGDLEGGCAVVEGEEGLVGAFGGLAIRSCENYLEGVGGG